MTIFSTSTAAFYDRSTMGMTSLREQAEKLQTQINTQNRLTASSDDPVAASRLRSLARTDALAKIDTAAANRATSDLNLADSALTEFSNTIIRMQELATQAASGTLTDDQRAGIGAEMKQIQSNLVALANTRDSAGHALFGGTATGAAYTVDAAGNASYAGTGSAGELALGDGQSVTRSVTGPEFLSFTVNGNSTDLMAVAKNLADALAAGGTAAATAAKGSLDSLQAGLEAVTTTQTVVGARLAWIDVNTQRQTTMSTARAQEKSDVGGTDLTEAFTRLQELSTVLSASQASFSKLSQLSLFSALS